jgi:hypothetical protein
VQALLWGGQPLETLVEPYTGAPGNRRLVQYFDRGRMELDAGTRAVTQGLLVRELVSGEMQLGDAEFIQHAPADIPVIDRPGAPTYADAGRVAGVPADDRTRSSDNLLDDWLQPGGQLLESAPPVMLHVGSWVAQTGHNLPVATVSWLDTRPFGAVTWQDALGYPISEPYWIGDPQQPDDARLVQLFERRVVVYTPSEPQDERFTLTDAGRHYYAWRYDKQPRRNEGRAKAEAAPADVQNAGLTLPEGYRAQVLIDDAHDVVDIAVTASGRSALGRRDGTVTLIDPTDPDADTAGPLVAGNAEPVALAAVGTALYVADSTGLHRYVDTNGDDIIDGETNVTGLSFTPGTIALMPGPAASLFVSGVPATADGTPVAGQSEATFLTMAAGEDALSAVLADSAAAGPFVVDDDGTIWTASLDGQLVQLLPGGIENNLFSLNGVASPEPGERSSTPTGLRDLLLYRPDGTNGDPYEDMLALVADDADSGRIVRLRKGTIVDFITGFDRPTAMASGLDGCLYVVDAGSGVLYKITPP